MTDALLLRNHVIEQFERADAASDPAVRRRCLSFVVIGTPADDFPRVEREMLVWHPAGAREPFTLALEELFRSV
jgi:hypothetical protein